MWRTINLFETNNIVDSSKYYGWQVLVEIPQSTNYRFEEIEEGEGDTVPMVTPKTSSNREFFSLSLSLCSFTA